MFIIFLTIARQLTFTCLYAFSSHLGRVITGSSAAWVDDSYTTELYNHLTRPTTKPELAPTAISDESLPLSFSPFLTPGHSLSAIRTYGFNWQDAKCLQIKPKLKVSESTVKVQPDIFAVLGKMDAVLLQNLPLSSHSSHGHWVPVYH